MIVTRAFFIAALLLASLYFGAMHAQGNFIGGSGGRHAGSSPSPMVGEGRQQRGEAAAANALELEDGEGFVKVGSYGKAHHLSIYEEVRMAANRRQLMEMQDHFSAEEV